ncbi:LPEAT1, partial [Symbiodinium natans]
YLGLGLGLHLLIWFCEVLRTLICPSHWPDVPLKNKRKSEGGEKAFVGEGYECYDYDTPGWPLVAIVKLAFALLTGLLPFRLIAFIIAFALNALVLRIGLCLSPKSMGHRVVDLIFHALMKLLCTFCACYVTEVFNKERLAWIQKPGSHPILVPNHISLVEAFHLHHITWGMSGCVAKSQLGIPGIGWAAKFMGAVVIDPKDKEMKEKVKSGIAQFAKNEPDAQGNYPFKRAFCIYPEGITNSQLGLYRFNTGAFSPGVPVLPILQRFPYTNMNPAWVSQSTRSPGNDLPWILIRYMSQITMPLHVKVMEIWEPTAAEIADPVLFASNVQNYMAMQLGCVVTDTSNKILREKGGPFDLKAGKVSPSERGDESVTERPKYA